MRSVEIRERFLRFFEERGHERVPSSPVVPYDDPTLLFTNAGMNQFKNIFLGLERRSYKRAASAQKCIRVSGKHNDLEQVGRDTTHHTFFEMLGNWSFGDYYKRKAIDFAWELLTKDYGLPPERLWTTVFRDDDEAEELWARILPRERILRFGKDENFWEMGDVGPCGPCTEIHLDLGPGHGCGRPDCGPNCPHCKEINDFRFVELWNLVFIQYNCREDGSLEELPEKHVDTGMGLERLAAILQGKDSNYDTDLFQPLIRKVEELSGRAYNEDPTPFRVVADHIRTLSFAIADGAVPSNEGRGYVLRRLLRRASRFGRKLDLHEPFLYRLVSVVGEVMGGAYPEVVEKGEYIAKVVKAEEEAFGRTLDRGLERFAEVVREVRAQGEGVLPGEEVFRLYDTYGFPLDLTQLMAEEEELAVDVEGFQKAMERQREQAREASRFEARAGLGEGWKVISEGPSSEFVGYEEERAVAAVRAVRDAGDGMVEVILSHTPFYAEAGGQVGDTGWLRAEGFLVEVVDAQRAAGEIVHRGRLREGSLERVPVEVIAEIDGGRRVDIRRNHTATHLLHKALREVLGEHVRQSGSLVAPDRLRFDFTHFAQMTPDELEVVEKLVNERIRQNLSVWVREMPLQEALKAGAIAIFGEKYGEVVRVVEVEGVSWELCGGTHVKATGEIGFFRMEYEGSVAAGIRRIEALTGGSAEKADREDRRTLSEVGRLVNASGREIVKRVEGLLERVRSLEKEVTTLRRKVAAGRAAELAAGAVEVEGLKVVAEWVDAPDMDALREVADQLKDALGRGVGVLGAEVDGKALLVAVATDDAISRGVRADVLVREVARSVGGGGGGRPHLAQAGGRNPEKLGEALASVLGIVRRILGEG